MKKITNRITVSLFLFLIFGFSIAFWILPDKAFSDEENRSLQTMPPFSIRSLTTGNYADAVNDYFADQFPLRDALVGWKGLAELAMRKGENNGILLGQGQQLARRLFDVRCADGTVLNDIDLTDPDQLQAASEAIERIGRRLSVPFTVMLTPRPIDVAAEAFAYPDDYSCVIHETFYRALSQKISTVDILPLFRDKYANDEYVYYKTDHHWTTRGAYYAYVELMREWGMEQEILSENLFEKQTVSENFYGTLWSAGGMKFVRPDKIEIWLLGNEDMFSVVADGKEMEGFYNKSYLFKKDQYSTFLDGTHDVVTITKKQEQDRPRLVLFKDSFANAIAPFLAQHFDLVLLNLSSRKDFTNVTALAEEYGADRALIVYTVENVVTADKLSKLR